jgi:hypothetical protein
MTDALPSPETCLAYASALEKPYRDVAGGIQHEPGEIARAAAAALRIVAEREAADLILDVAFRYANRQCDIAELRETIETVALSVKMTRPCNLEPTP